MDDHRAREAAIDESLGRAVRRARRLKGMTQKQLASVTGLQFQQIGKYETGANRMSASRIVTISRAMDVPVSQLFAGIDCVL